MNEIVAKEPPSVIADMAQRYGMDKRAFEATLKATVVPANVSNEQFAAFLLVAREYKLNPLTKEIYAFPAKSGGIQPIVSIDGWCNIINSHPQLDGIEFDDVKDDKGQITAIACKIHRKDRTHPIIAIEYMGECKGVSDPWKRWPARMLRHKSLIQAARYAFGFSGIVDPDEAERIQMVDVTPPAKSVFKNSSLRKEWEKKVSDSFDSATSTEELEQIGASFQDRMNEVHGSGNESDMLTVEELERKYKLVFDKLQDKESVADSFGQGFAETRSEPEEEEVKPEPIKLTALGWQRELNNAATEAEVLEKHKLAAEQFSNDVVALGALNTTKDKRIAALKKEAA